MIYIASPYSSPIPELQSQRFVQVRTFTAKLFNEGLNPFSPIVYAHEMARVIGLKTDALTWLRFNSDMLRHSEAVFVLCLPNWETSKGVKIEIQQAKALSMDLRYFDPDGNPIEIN